MDRPTLDRLMDGEISKFEKDLQARQRASGLSGNDPLSTVERGVLKAFILFARTP